MDNVLTIVGPTKGRLAPALVDQISKNLMQAEASIGQTTWLSEHQACDIHFTALSCEDADAICRQTLDGQPFDILAQPTTHRRKKLLVADMDSTIVEGETLDDLAELAGIGTRIAEITARAMNGEILFRDALRERMAMLRGLDASYLERTAKALKLNPGAQTLVRTMAGNGAYTALVSGGFEFFTTRVAKQIGFDFNKGNQIEIINGRFSGNVINPIITKAVKLETLEALAGDQQITMAETLAVGDGANDLPMLMAAGLGVAYHAKPIVVSQARAAVTHSDLATLLYYQGYKQSEFVA